MWLAPLSLSLSPSLGHIWLLSMAMVSSYATLCCKGAIIGSHTTPPPPTRRCFQSWKLRLIDWTHSIPAFPSNSQQQSLQTNQTNKFGNGVPLVRFVIHLDNLIAASIDHRSFSLSSSSLMGPASQRRKKGWQLRFFKPGGWRSCRFLVRRSVMRPEGDIRCCQGG